MIIKLKIQRGVLKQTAMTRGSISCLFLDREQKIVRTYWSGRNVPLLVMGEAIEFADMSYGYLLKQEQDNIVVQICEDAHQAIAEGKKYRYNKHGWSNVVKVALPSEVRDELHDLFLKTQMLYMEMEDFEERNQIKKAVDVLAKAYDEIGDLSYFMRDQNVQRKSPHF